jgi:hypothetical protein
MRVAEIWRYPIKSLRGESLREVHVLRDGIPGDRAVHVVDGAGELITARSRPDLVLLSATLGPDGEPLIDGHPWGGDQAATSIQSVAGTRARLVRSPAATASTTRSCSLPPTAP